MPKLSGIEVAHRIRTNRWAVGILILTSYDDDPFISAVLKVGANGYVLKTASPDDIITAVRDVYQGKFILDATVLPKVLAQISASKNIPVVGPLTEHELEILWDVSKRLKDKAKGGSE